MSTDASTPNGPHNEVNIPPINMPRSQEEHAKQTQDAAKLVQNLIKQMTFGLTTIPLFVQAATHNDTLKNADPEKYYAIKAGLREMLLEFEKDLPNLKLSLEKMK